MAAAHKMSLEFPTASLDITKIGYEGEWEL